MPEEDTLVDRWKKKIFNNPLGAAILLAGFAVTTVSGGFNALPPDVQKRIIGWFVPQDVPSNGWAFVGVLDKEDNLRWVSQPKVEMVRQSGALDRAFPFRPGDRIRITTAIPQVIIDFKREGTKNVLSRPTSMVATINPDTDYTGATYPTGREYDVMDIDVNGYSGHDKVMWLRLVR